MQTIRLLIKGKVQGVFFRATAKKVADSLELKGWIRNTASGDVEAVVTGMEEQLQQFTEWCRKGPENAEVSSLDVSETPLEDFSDFIVIRYR